MAGDISPPTPDEIYVDIDDTLIKNFTNRQSSWLANGESGAEVREREKGEGEGKVKEKVSE